MVGRRRHAHICPVLAVGNASLVAHWIGRIGALSITIGSGIQAASKLAEYRAELKDLRVATEAAGVLRGMTTANAGLLAVVPATKYSSSMWNPATALAEVTDLQIGRAGRRERELSAGHERNGARMTGERG